ncbi:MAG: hypothetical protein GKS06_01635 [Acidobacteria bacterium]|nr:hypothetical protein [Acidobacteriota bacterium]
MKRAALALLMLAIVAPACSPPSADDLVRGVMEQRRNYTAELKSWAQREDGSLYLDILVVNNNAEGSLRNLTVLVRQLDADDNVIGESRESLNVSTLTPGLGQPVGVTVAGASARVEGAYVVIEPQPEEAEWSDFPEFDAVRPRV